VPAIVLDIEVVAKCDHLCEINNQGKFQQVFRLLKFILFGISKPVGKKRGLKVELLKNAASSIETSRILFKRVRAIHYCSKNTSIHVSFRNAQNLIRTKINDSLFTPSSF
jgi:hypothetical protein